MFVSLRAKTGYNKNCTYIPKMFVVWAVIIIIMRSHITNARVIDAIRPWLSRWICIHTIQHWTEPYTYNLKYPYVCVGQNVPNCFDLCTRLARKFRDIVTAIAGDTFSTIQLMRYIPEYEDQRMQWPQIDRSLCRCRYRYINVSTFYLRTLSIIPQPAIQILYSR